MLGDIDLIFWIVMSYRSSLHFLPGQWFLAELWLLDFEIWPKIQLSPVCFALLGDIDLIFGIWVYSDELQIKFTFVPVQWFLALGLGNLAKYLIVTTFFAMLVDIDLIFSIWVYNDELQIKFTFRSGSMIFGRVMALGLGNLVKYLVVTTFFAMLGDIDLIFGIWVYNDELHIKITFCSGSMIFGPWTLKFGQLFSCQHFFSVCLEILTWFLA